MFIDWWMLLLFIIIAGLWGEYRYNNGINTAKFIDKTNINSLLMAKTMGSVTNLLSFMAAGLLYHNVITKRIVGYDNNDIALTEDENDALIEAMSHIQLNDQKLIDN